MNSKSDKIIIAESLNHSIISNIRIRTTEEILKFLLNHIRFNQIACTVGERMTAQCDGPSCGLSEFLSARRLYLKVLARTVRVH